MSTLESRLFASASLLEKGGSTGTSNEDVDQQFLTRVLQKRIEAFKLPISFSSNARLAVLTLVDRPGSVVVLLIDCLNAYEGQTVTVDMLAELYPIGFYDEVTLSRYIEDFLKQGKVKWSEIY
jgi:hypothetical protein